MAPRNHAACVDNYCDAILSGEIIAGRSLLAQFGLTPKSKRRLASSEAVDPLAGLWLHPTASVGRPCIRW